MESNTSSYAADETKTAPVKPTRSINVYATLGIGLLVFAALVLLTVVLAGVESVTQASYGSVIPTASVGYGLAATAVFLTLPALFNSRYGWRTVVATYLFQSLLAFVVLILLSLFVPAQDSPVYPSSLDINSGTQK